MTAQQFTDNGLEIIVGNFLQELEDAPDRDAVTRRYVEAYPAIATVIQDLGAQERIFTALRPDTDTDYPKQLPDFQIIREIGRGGMGVVFEAWQESLERRVALKIHRGNLTGLELDRFRREQLVLAQLHQTNIVPIHVAGEHGPWHYFAMAYVEGASLHQIIRRTHNRDTLHRGDHTPTLAETAREELKHRGNHTPSQPSAAEPTPAPAEKFTLANPRDDGPESLSGDYFTSVASFIAATAEAAHHAHTVGVIHRDLKPSNVLVDVDGQPRLIDFGLAWRRQRAIQDVSAAETAIDPVLTYGPMGTPRYMAPERWLDPTADPDARVDVWALGTILYELLALRPAFDAKSSEEVRRQVLGQRPAPLRSLVKNVPPDLAAVCRKALRKDPAERYQSALELADDLRRWLRHEPTEAHGFRLFRRPVFWARRSPSLVTALTVAATALIGVLILGMLLANKKRVDALDRATEADQRDLISRRDLLLRQLERHRLIQKELGWSEKAWRTASELVELNAGGNLRDQAAAVLIGMDATTQKTFSFKASAFAWDPKGERLLMGGNPQQPAQMWDVSKLDPVALGHRGDGLVTFTKDGRPLQLVKLDDGTLRVYDAAKNQVVRDLKLPGDGKANLSALALAEDGSRAAAVINHGGKTTIAVWDIGSGKLLKQWDRETTDIALTPDGAFLAAGSVDGIVSVFTVPDGKEVATLKGTRRASVSALAFGKNVRRTQDAAPLAGWLLAVGDVGAGVTVWNPSLAVPVSYCDGSENQIFTLAFSPDGVTLASAGRVRVTLWDIPTGKPVLSLPVGDYYNALAFSPDGGKLAVSYESLGGNPPKPAVHILEIQNGRGVKSLRGLVGQTGKVFFSPDGTRVAAVSHAMETAVWEWPSGRLLHVFDTPRGVWVDSVALAISHDNTKLAYSSHNRAVLYDLTTGKELRSWDLPIGFVEHMAFDKDDKRLMLFRVETTDPKVAPWGTDPGKFPRVGALRDLLGKEPLKPVKEIKDYDVHVYDAVIAADANVIVVDGLGTSGGKRQRKVKAFSGLTGEELWSMEPERTTHSQILALDPSGTVLSLHFSGGDDKPHYLPRLYDAKTGKLLGPLGRKGGAWAISAGGEYWGVATDAGFSVGRRDEDEQLLTLGLDITLGYLACRFHPRHSQVAWGARDGTVLVADLVQVQRKLAELKLGW